MNKTRRKAAASGWRLQDDRPPTFRGWLSTDSDEISRREWRGRTEIGEVHALDEGPHSFGDYRVTSSSGSRYTVEIRSLDSHINSCECRDYRTNCLGTCKHIGVLDQRGDLSEIPLPTGRAAFMERLNAVLDAQTEAAAASAADASRALTAVEELRDGLVAEHGATLERIFVREDEEAVLVVLSLPPEGIVEEERRLAESTELGVKVIDPTTHESMLRLAEAGLIALPAGELREVYPAPDSEHSEVDSRTLRAKALAERAEHKLKAAALLESGGFAEEARTPAVEAARLAVGSLAAMRREPEPADADSAVELLLGEEPDAFPGGPPHDAIRVPSGDEADGGAAAPIGELVSGISRMLADLPAASRGAAG